MNDEKVSINRQEIITVDGLHYKQEYRLIGIESEPEWEEIISDRYLHRDRFMTSPGITYKWLPTMTSGPYGVWPTCGDCGGKNIFYRTHSMATAIKAGFLKLVAPVKN